MTAPRLRDHPWKISYGPADDRLNEFYIPALSCSVAYDRSAGFFSSSSLATAAAGLAHLIRNGGRMRLLVGAQLAEADVRAIEEGYDLRERIEAGLLRAFEDPADHLKTERLRALAWMIARGTLDIRVVFPTDPDGRPVPSNPREAYFHVKTGRFTDAGGDQVAFSGSVNESETAWQRNYEDLAVYTSWATEASDSRAHLRGVVERFNRLWEDREEYWKALPVPQAVLDRLLEYAPREAPAADPLEKGRPRKREDGAPPDQDERILFRFVRDAPRLVGARRIAAATSTIRPWPHQARIAEIVTSRYPEGFLLCDEVGLGKTIEAGLILRQLVLDGRVRRALILAPKSITRQFQEELYEKFVLDVPLFDGRTLRDVRGRERPPRTENPWDSEPIFIASSQLAKRRDRRDEVLAAGPFDLLIVDEAHHARRRGFNNLDEHDPNNLLRLLLEIRERERARCVLLMTATPLQVHPVEVYDLLRLLGMAGRWGAHPLNFLRFFSEMKRPSTGDIDWRFVLDMVNDARAMGVGIEEPLARALERRIGPVEWERVRRLPESPEAEHEIARLGEESRRAAREMVRRLTPLRARVHRSTRALLRKYRERGILKENVPRRSPRQIWIGFTPAEERLYAKVETYISDFYRRYEEKRRGLGFVMTVYRRRLTSSFYALGESLRRRLDYLRGERAVRLFHDDDIDLDGLETDIDETLLEEPVIPIQEEMEYLEEYLSEIEKLPADSKLQRLLDDLRSVFRERETVVIFTQYTDTMDYLRDRLKEVYGSQVACYSGRGRGGELWDGVVWKPVSKEEIKALFKAGAEVKVLIGTEALSEGLNLQTCGVLINFDMPWNPMRVEQRIGRIDRIGQRHEVVWILNYFYEKSVEADVYRRLEDRIDWFETVLGALQPILGEVGRTIEELSMAGPEGREERLAAKVQALRRGIDEEETEGLNLDEYIEAEPVAPSAETDPVPLAELGRLLLGSRRLAGHFRAHPEIREAYLLALDTSDQAVTFDREAFDQHPNTLRLLTYGEPLLDDLLYRFPEPAGSPSGPGRLLRSETEEGNHVGYHSAPGGDLRGIEAVGALRECLEAGAAPIAGALVQAAGGDLGRRAGELRARERDVVQSLAVGDLLAREEEARMLLRRAAYLDLALRSRTQQGPPGEAGGAAGMPEVRLTSVRDYVLTSAHPPYAAVFVRLGNADIPLSAADPYFQKALDSPEKSLRARSDHLRREASNVLDRLETARRRLEELRRASDEPAVTLTRVLR